MEEPPSEQSSDEPSLSSFARTPSEQSSDEPSIASLSKTPSGSSVGVDDPYEHVDRCDHCTDDGKCRFAFERFEADPAFARERRDDDYRCPVAASYADADAVRGSSGRSDGGGRSVDGGDSDGDANSDVDGGSADEWECWADCPNFASTTDGTECRRCGLEERRVAHADERALLEEHHLSYEDGGERGDGRDDGHGRGEGRDGDRAADVNGDDANAKGDASAADPAHEITVALCRWCHAKVHRSWARVDDDVSPDPEAIAAREQRRGQELEEASFKSAAERYDDEE